MNERETTPSGNLPDAFDRQIAALIDLPDVVKTSLSTVRVVPPLGVGGTQSFSVQTIRQRERGDFVFIEVLGQHGATRLVLPPAVSRILARQRDALTDKARSKSAKAVAAERKAQGIAPAFQKTTRRKA